MRERLTQLIHDAHMAIADRDDNRDTYTAIADHLLDNGVIVLPAYIGQTVWIVDEYEVLEDVVYEIGHGTTQSGEIKWLFLVEDSSMDFYDSDIGKTVFLTREAAEEAMKARDNNAD